jgi:hypothetical protein
LATTKAIFGIRTRRGGRARRALLATTLLLAIGLATAAPAGAAVPRAFYGIMPGTALTQGDFKRMANARVGSLRVGLFWPGIQPKHHGPLNWASTDALVASAARKRISVLPILLGTPRYEADGCGSQACSRRIRIKSKSQRQDWQAFVKAAVQRYGHNGGFWQANSYLPYEPISRWQIWNEENSPKQHNSAKVYAKLLTASDKAVHAVDAHGKIMLGGMPGTPKGGKSATAWGYLARLYKAGAGKHFDAVALHPYSATIAGIRKQVKRIRRVLKRRHDANKATFITEIGWGSSRKRHAGTGSRGAAFNVGPKQQKRKLAQSFGLLTGHRRGWRIGGVYWYQWKDPRHAPAGLCAFCYSSGLYKADGKRAKPALSAYKRFTRKTRG